MGYSMVTEKYHYVQWQSWDHVKGVAGEEVLAVELYDLVTDPDENQNVADFPKYQQQRKQLADKLAQQWPESSLATQPQNE